MFRIKIIIYNNLIFLLLFFILFSCNNERCTNLKINKRFDLVSGVLLGDTLLTTVSALDTIVGHSFVPEIVGFNLKGDSIFRRKVPFDHAGIFKQEDKIFSHSYISQTKIKIYDHNINIHSETNTVQGALFLYKEKIVRDGFSSLGIILQGKNYLDFYRVKNEDEYIYSAARKSSYKEYNQTSFQGFAGDSHVYNDTLYVEDKCFCIEGK